MLTVERQHYNNDAASAHWEIYFTDYGNPMDSVTIALGA